MDERWVRADASPWRLRLLAVGVALLVTAPLLAPGYVLLRDMVAVPRLSLGPAALGLGSGLPRAVPEDAVVALLTTVVPGQLVQKAALFAAVALAVLGAARLVPPDDEGRRGMAGAAAGLVYGWSPWVAERLLMGHWSLLLGYAALPWVARSALLLRAGAPGGLARLVLACALAALTPSGTLLAAGVALVLVGRRRLGPVLAVLLALAGPWVVAGLLHPGGTASASAGVAAFAARSENWAGSLVAVLGTGGIWNAGAVPASRASVLAPLVTVLLVALAGWGWAASGALRAPGPVRRLVGLAAVGLVLACAGTVPGLRDVLESVVTAVPGGGLLRDGQKWAAWPALALALGAGLGVRALHPVPAGRALAAVALLLPLVAVPDLVWGVGGRLQPVAVPADWAQARALLEAGDDPGDVLVLPFAAIRSFDWNDDRPQLDPAPRWLPRTAVVDDTLVVGGTAVEGEDTRAAQVGALAGDPAALAAAGVGWVLVEHGTPGPSVPAAVSRLPRVLHGPALDLYRVPGAVAAPAPGTARAVAVVAAHLLAGVVVGAAGLSFAVRGPMVPFRRRRPRGKRSPA